MRSYQREREEFIATMVGEGMDLHTARLILRDAATVQRYAAEACNRELAKSERKREAEAMRRIALRIHVLRGHQQGPNWRVKFGGDPRGACVKIKVPSGRSNDWGGEGVCVPTRGF